MDIMHQKNFESIHGAKRSRRGENTLRREKTSGGIGDTGSWGVESAQELKKPKEEPRNRQ
jgi:hypothetical protein